MGYSWEIVGLWVKAKEEPYSKLQDTPNYHVVLKDDCPVAAWPCLAIRLPDPNPNPPPPPPHTHTHTYIHTGEG